ncbi:MAG: hypothetical protein AB1806_17435 [Acidobacteriota bacterium]
MAHPHRNPLVAAVLSLGLPGAGQFYTGSYVVGVFWIAIAAAFWYLGNRTLAPASHVLAAVSAYWSAERLNQAGRRRRR